MSSPQEQAQNADQAKWYSPTAAVLVEYQKYSGRSPTGAEAHVLGMLASRGFPVVSYGTADGVDPTIAYLTILLGNCEDAKLTNAIRQIEKITTVIQAHRRELSKVTQDLHARTIGLTDEQRGVLLTAHGADIHRTVLFDTNTHGAKGITRRLHRAGAKIAKAKRSGSDSGDLPDNCHLQVRMVNPNMVVQQEMVTLGGKFRDMEYVRRTADVPHVQALADYMRSEVAQKIEYMHVGPPKATIRVSDDAMED